MSATVIDPSDIYNRPWQALETFEAWLECWQAAQSPQEAVGLLHAGVFYVHSGSGTNLDTCSLRFLLKVASPQAYREAHPTHLSHNVRPPCVTGRYCPHRTIREKAVDVLMTQVLANRSVHNMSDILAADDDLMDQLLGWLVEEARMDPGSDDARKKHERLVRGWLLMVTAQLDSTSEITILRTSQIERHREAIYRACCHWECHEFIVSHSPVSLAALERVVFTPLAHSGGVPATIEEAMAHGHTTPRHHTWRGRACSRLAVLQLEAATATRYDSGITRPA